MATHEGGVELTEGAKEVLVERGFDPAMGARPLRRAISGIEDRSPTSSSAASSLPARRSSSTAAEVSCPARKASGWSTSGSWRASRWRRRPTVPPEEPAEPERGPADRGLTPLSSRDRA